MAGPWDNYASAPAPDAPDAPAPWTKYSTPPEPSAAAKVGDFVKSIPGGVAKGARGFADFAKTVTGANNDAPGTDPIGDAAGGAFTNLTKDLPQPQGTAGQYGQTIGEFLGNPTSYAGAGGLMPKVASTIGSAVGSEAMGQAAAGTPYEGIARLVGALPSGLLRGQEALTPGTPSRADLGAATDADYTAGRATGLRIQPAAAGQVADRIQADMTNAGHDPVNNPVFRAVDRLRQSGTGGSVSMDDIEAARRALSLHAAGADPILANAANIGVRGIDDYRSNIPPADVVSGDPVRTSQFFDNGRSNSAAGKRSDEIQGRLDAANRATMATVSQKNFESPIRQRANSLLNTGDYVNGDVQLHGYSPQEVEGLRGVVEGSHTGNALQQLGQLDPMRGAWRGLMEGGMAGSAIMSGDPGAIALTTAIPAVGIAARKASEILTRNRMNAVDEMTRRRSALGQSMPPDATTQMSPVAAMMLGLTSQQTPQPAAQ